MMTTNKKEKLGVLIPGMGSVASTLFVVVVCNKNLAKPVGSMTDGIDKAR